MAKARRNFLDRLLGGGEEPPPSAPPPPPPPGRLTLDTSLLDQEPMDGWIAAIDFGTTLSKAALVRISDAPIVEDDVHPLQLGDGAGPGAEPLTIRSALYIWNGRIFFGSRAFEMHTDADDPAHRRFESPKHYISQLNQDLLNGRASKEEDPSGQFTRGDLLALLLGFLAHRFDLALRNIRPLKGRIPRLRISRPAWKAEAEEDGEALLGNYLGRAFILARTLGDRLSSPDGLSVEVAREALNLLQDAPEASARFQKLLMRVQNARNSIGRGFVPESTAVAAAHVEPESGQGRALVVADIGGGTSDFGAFLSVPGRNRQGRLGELANVRQCLEKGGNHIDSLAYEYLAARNKLNPGLPAHQASLARLARDIRRMKETLFTSGQLHGDFEGTLEEFLKQDDVVAFAEELRQTFRIPYDEARTYNRQLRVIKTGGGASLPFVAALGARETPMPGWIESPNLQQNYPLMAVAIGAAMPHIPEAV